MSSLGPGLGVGRLGDSMASPPEEQAEVPQVAGPNSMAVESSTRRSLPKETWLVDDYAAMPPPVEFMVCATRLRL